MEKYNEITTESVECVYISDEEAVALIKNRISDCSSLKEITKLLREVKKSVKPRERKPRRKYTRRSVKFSLGDNDVTLTVKVPEGEELPTVESVKDGESELLIQVQAQQRQSIAKEASHETIPSSPETTDMGDSSLPQANETETTISSCNNRKAQQPENFNSTLRQAS